MKLYNFIKNGYRGSNGLIGVFNDNILIFKYNNKTIYKTYWSFSWTDYDFYLHLNKANHKLNEHIIKLNNFDYKFNTSKLNNSYIIDCEINPKYNLFVDIIKLDSNIIRLSIKQKTDVVNYEIKVDDIEDAEILKVHIASILEFFKFVTDEMIDLIIKHIESNYKMLKYDYDCGKHFKEARSKYRISSRQK